MKAQKVQHYDHPQQFEPLMPGGPALDPLLERASDLTRAATALGSSAGLPARGELRALLRSMNSYYTNRMEGEHTQPSDIERALQQDFSKDDKLARKQRLAVAHIRTELLCENELDERSRGGEEVASGLYSADGLRWLHGHLFGGLTELDLTLIDKTLMVPGDFRTRPVKVGRHEAPTPDSVPAFVGRWADFYRSVRRGEASIVAAAAAHHRLAWVHPFLDGNGRTARLHTHLVFHALGLTSGLWSPLRGFARTEERYKALLQAADEHRRGDLDGRGNLTEAGLVEWIRYTLEVCQDQIEFMGTQLDVAGMKDRIAAALAFEESTIKSGVRADALRPLHYLFSSERELGRSEFKSMMTELGDRTATGVLSALLERGFLKSDTPHGKVRFGVPRHALRFYFPALWPEAEQDESRQESVRRKLTTMEWRRALRGHSDG